LMTRDALRSIVAGVARGADLARLALVVLLEAGTVSIAEAVEGGDEATVIELRLDQAAELGETTIAAMALLVAVAMTLQARRHRGQLGTRREIDAAHGVTREAGLIRVRGVSELERRHDQVNLLDGAVGTIARMTTETRGDRLGRIRRVRTIDRMARAAF